ncbi:hypothetical protein GCM10011416_15730 [Polaribacter pacificus]|uniref:HTH araC/xylS-type domain-containing protein n=1 Tax=Polaribacter pacificus TaxID=1775173 RepID=A0A917HZJ1_9FLAO|nr:helix-turn-helix domain-containing protein [Polaribacter pacificus]GGG98440.1 hypothetical protein GCM10011416_15730 [Polaribacter pacificus]
MSIRIGKSVYSLATAREERDLFILQIGLSACFLIGVSVFYYLKASVENTKKIPVFWKVHIVFLVLFIFIVGLIKPYATHVVFWNTYFVPFIYTVWGVYLLSSILVLKTVFYNFFSKNNRCTTSELWLIAVLIANSLIFAAYIVGYFYLYLVGTITFSIVFYALLIFLLFKKNREDIFRDIPEKYQAKKIEKTEASQLGIQLNSVMTQKLFHKNSEVKIQHIAKELDISSHKLSQFLNDNLGKSFALFINEYRIEEAKTLIKEKDHFTLEAIGFESGFSSKSTFYATFKKLVGLTPAAYKKQAKQT